MRVNQPIFKGPSLVVTVLLSGCRLICKFVYNIHAFVTVQGVLICLFGSEGSLGTFSLCAWVICNEKKK